MRAPRCATPLALVRALALRTAGAQLVIPSVTDTHVCNWAELPEQVTELNGVCCFESAGNPGARCSGVECDVACAAQLLPLLHQCHP